MRPLISVKPLEKYFAYPADALLMMSMGEFCVMCERPLLAESMVWHRDREEIVQGEINSGQWDEVLLLCHNCAQEAQNSKAKNLTKKGLLYPDRTRTFGLDTDEVFRYSLEKVEQVVIDENNEPVGDPVVKEVAFVSGQNESIQKTIDYFKLNSHYYDSEKKKFFFPKMEEPYHQDRRLELRTRAWRQAEEFVKLYKGAKYSDVQTAMAVNLKNAISHGGFWSVWVTVFWKNIPDKSLMRELFTADKKISALKGTLNDEMIFKGQGPHNPFPGSSDSWL